jgi:hypothetical protein
LVTRPFSGALVADRGERLLLALQRALDVVVPDLADVASFASDELR